MHKFVLALLLALFFPQAAPGEILLKSKVGIVVIEPFHGQNIYILAYDKYNGIVLGNAADFENNREEGIAACVRNSARTGELVRISGEYSDSRKKKGVLEIEEFLNIKKCEPVGSPDF